VWDWTNSGCEMGDASAEMGLQLATALETDG